MYQTLGGYFMEILRVENLSKIYGSGETAVRAVDDVSFTIKKGEFVAVIGPSGSGKSTLLHIIGGVDIPTKGKVLVDSSDIYALDETNLAIFRRRQVGLIYQFYNLIPVLNVRENITLPLLLDGREVNEKYLMRLVQSLGLEDRLTYLPNQLSGGQQQRVSIGRALINKPAIVLADEPTGNLDSTNSREILELLRMFNETYRQTLIIVTHDETIALKADRVIALKDGRIVKDEVIRP
jgi:putative ABC transport system ATP-binding protein